MSQARRILYLQYVNPATYPPLEHSSRLLADRGWSVEFLGIESVGSQPLRLPSHQNMKVKLLSYCGPGWAQKWHYLRFSMTAVFRVLIGAPDWIYISEPLTCVAALPLLLWPGVRLLYHEHDALGPTPTVFLKLVAFSRNLIARWAGVCVLPNRGRAAHLHQRVQARGQTLVVWNCPSREEAGVPHPSADPTSLWLVYQGSLSPPRLPVAVLEALSLLPSSVKLRVMGYETIGHRGFCDRLAQKAEALGVRDRVEFVKTLCTRSEVLEAGRSADIGLAFMPMKSEDLNMKTMAGASNKAFDYLACGMPLLVSDLPEWREMFVDPGFARICNPEDAQSVKNAVLGWLAHPEERHRLGEAGRQKILSDWNYEAQFEPVSRVLEDDPAQHDRGLGFAARLIRRIPASVRGKTRLARLLLRSELARRESTLEDRSGCQYLLPSLREPIAFHLLIEGAYETEGLRLLGEVLRPGSVFVDVGANVGVYTLPLARHVGPSGKVISIEASPRIMNYLKKNVALNGLSNVLAYEGAALDAEGTISFYEAPDDHFGMGSVLAQFGAAPISVKTFRLDDLLAKNGITHVDALKLDVEGSEAAALEGAKRILTSPHPPIVLFEFNAARDADQLAEKKLREWGFRIRTMDDFLQGRHTSDRRGRGLEMLVGDKVA